MNTIRTHVLSLAAIALLFACKAAPGPSAATDPSQSTAELPADPVATEPAAPKLRPIVAKDAPTSLIGVVTFPNPANDLRNLGQFADVVQPGASMALPAIFTQNLGQAVGQLSIGGLDMSKPVRVVVLRDGASVNAVIVATVSDESELNSSLDPSKGQAIHRIHNGHVAIAEAHVLPMVRDYALTKLLEEPVPAFPTLAVDVSRLVEGYRQELAMARMGLPMAISALNLDSAAAAMLTSLANMMLSTVEETKHFRVSLIASGKAAELAFAVTANPGTSLATFANSQKASDFTTLQKLLASPTAIAIGGDINWSSAKGFFASMTEALVSQMGADPALTKASDDWLDVMTGSVGATVNADPSALDLNMLTGVTDSKKARAAMRTYQNAFKKNKELNKLLQYRLPAFTYKGAPVDSMKFMVPANKMDADNKKLIMSLFGKEGPTVYSAVAKDYYMLTSGKKAKNNIRSLIARGTMGKSGRAPAVARVIADAKARKESMVLHLDLARMIGSWSGEHPKPARPSGSSITWGLGFATNTIMWRLTVPAAHVKAIQAVSGSI